VSLYRGHDCKKLYNPSLNHTEFGTVAVSRDVTRAQPVLLMLRLTIELALRDALRVRDGMPTEEALDAVTWIQARTDWTRRRGPIPPAELRGENVFSFEWCCSLLNLDAEQTRQHGLLRLSGLAHNSKHWLPGLPGIRAHWQKAHEEYEARQLTEATVVTTSTDTRSAVL